MYTLQSCTGPVQGQNRVFPVNFSTQGKTCFHYKEPCSYCRDPCFHYRDFPSVTKSYLFLFPILIFLLQHKTGFEANYCKAFSNKRKRPEMMDRQDDQPVRLASPSINVLDYRSVNLYELNYQIIKPSNMYFQIK